MNLIFFVHLYPSKAMPLIRLIVLLLVLGSLALLLVQNWLPLLPLVFLGWQTPPLPLAVWILLSLTAGIATSLLIAGLFQLSTYLARSGSSKRPKQESTTYPTNPPNSQTNYTATASSPPPPTNPTVSNDSTDEWESESKDEDWNFEEEEDVDKKQDFREQEFPKDSTTYEVTTEPKTSSRSGSVYSYSYREPKNSGVGRTESIYDADYRVLTPPYQPPEPVKDEDDWDFLEDDDGFKDQGESDSQQKWR